MANPNKEINILFHPTAYLFFSVSTVHNIQGTIDINNMIYRLDICDIPGGRNHFFREDAIGRDHHQAYVQLDPTGYL